MFNFFIPFFVTVIFLLPFSVNAAVSVSLTSSASTLYKGQSATLTWSSVDAYSCTGTGFSTNGATAGSVTVTPSNAGTYSYSISCTSSTPACTWNSISSYTDSVGEAGGSCSGTCAPKNATCEVVTRIKSNLYSYNTYQCTGSCVTASGSKSIVVSNPPPPAAVTASLSASPTLINKGSSAVLTWSSGNASSCTGTNFSTGNAVSGSVSVAPNTTTSYTLMCTEAVSNTGYAWTQNNSSWTKICSANDNPTDPNTSFQQPFCSDVGGGAGATCTVDQLGDVCKSHAYEGAGACTGQGTVYGTMINYTCSTANNTQTPQTSSSIQTVTVNQPPALMTITGPTTGVPNTAYTYTFKSTDPENNTIDYFIDWDNDGSTSGGQDQSFLAVVSGVIKSVSKTWTSTGTKTFQAYARDQNGLVSSPQWKSYTTTVSNPTPLCADGIDNDGDGRIDLNDYGCTDASDTTETPNPQCSDGINNDSDSWTDYPNDPGCTSYTDTTENPNPQCSDGIDNNGNGLIDLADIGACSGPTDGSEVVPDASQSLVAPSLIAPNTTALLVWSVSNVQTNSCTITGTNGENSGTLSGTSGTYVSDPLTSETSFTLQCLDLNDDAVSESAIVKIAPSFNEI